MYRIDPTLPRARFRRGVATVVSIALITSIMAELPANAAVARAPHVVPTKTAGHGDLPLGHAEAPAMPVPAAPVAADWPAPGEAAVVLTAPASTPAARADREPAEPGPAVRAGALPVRVAGGGGARATVRLADQAASRKAGITGVLLSVGGAPGRYSVDLDYSSFRNASGGGFGERLKLVGLPGCVLSTPDLPACRTRTPVASRNDPAAKVVSADVAVAGQPQVLAAVADSGGAGGTFAASSLAPSGSWSVTDGTGAFTWSYPVELPPAATGTAVAPKVALSYNSATVDGRTAATNNQSSWAGQGWDYDPGYVERTYRACADDDTLPEANKTGDFCWAGQIVTMNLAGQTTALVRDDATGTWKSSSDNGARVELLKGAANGALEGEHWRITTVDGIQYYFGLNRAPGSAEQDKTNSTWTAPVYGPHGDDPCHDNAGFAKSVCTQAWRWNLDYVEDPHGNATVYSYTPETNYYGANLQTKAVPYTRGGTLKRIDYGLRKLNGSVYGSAAPGKVVFDTAERCVPDGAITCDPAQFTPANAKAWPDTPQDQQCKADATCDNHSPTFWSTRRLTAITTQYDTGAGPKKADTYALTQQFPGIGDKELWLDSITHTGFAADGTSITLPPIKFTGQLYANRVVGYKNLPSLAHWRLTNITTDTGSVISVAYSAPGCTAATVPADLPNNTSLCYPVYWNLPTAKDPILDFFHKYVVEEVRIEDANKLSPTQVNAYTYVGSPAWHSDDNEIVKPKYRTYGQFRGYGQVDARTGDTTFSIDGVADTRTLTRTTYFRGMDGDPLPGGGKRSVAVTSSLGDSAADDNTFAGSPRETQLFNGDGGARISTSVSDVQKVATTATRARTGLPALTANVVKENRTRTVTDLAAGGTRTKTTAQRYDKYGRTVAKTDSGDGLPDTCVTTKFAENTASWILDRSREVLTSTEACPDGDPTAAKVTAGIRTYYDGQDGLGAVTGAGDATRVDTATANNGGTLTWVTTGRTTYDAAGRTTSTTDARNYTATITMTPADGGILSKTVKTNPKKQSETIESEPVRGKTTGSVDIAGRRTDATYDALGRLVAVWKPGQAKGGPASGTYEYVLRTDAPLAVVTKNLVDYGTGTNYLTTVELRDSFGQVRQVQTDANDGTRMVTDTVYDSHGWVRKTNNRYLTSGVPGTTLVAVADAAVDNRTVNTYDGSGRVVAATDYEGLTPTSSTRTVYGGDRTTVIPPQGDVTQTTITDTQGRMSELWRYSSAPAVTGDVVSGGTHDTTRYGYTPTGLQDKVTDTAGNVWSAEYDFLGHKVKQADPDTGTSYTEVDVAGLVKSATDARGKKLAYTYDELGRKTAEYENSVDGPKRASWVWDTAPNGVGQIFYSTRYTATGNWVTGVSAYNAEGRPSKAVTQVPASETGLFGTYTTLYGYTSTGLPTMVQPPSGGGLPGEAIAITYDKYGKPLTTAGYNAYVSASHYTPYGEDSQFTLGPSNSQAWLTYDYDPQTRRKTDVNLSAQLAATTQLDDTRYTYDPAGNITKSVNTQGVTGIAPVRTQCFGYDPMNRLAQAWTTTDDCQGAPAKDKLGAASPYWLSWTFKPNGLRETQTDHKAGTATAYQYPADGAAKPHSLTGTTTTGPAGTTTTSYGYDESGNTTTRDGQTLDWGPDGRLGKVTSPQGETTYVYDADGGQLLRRSPDKVTLSLPGEDLVKDTKTGVVTGTRYYSHNGVVVAMRVGGANPQYVVSDLHNTATVIVDSVTFGVTRRAMDPYGNPVGERPAWPDQRGFLGKVKDDSTGLTDVGARKYDSATGRFISVDAVLDVKNPDQLCGYSYAENNPITRSDPSGNLTIVGVGIGGIMNALGMAHDLQVTGARTYRQAHISIRWGYLTNWRPNFMGPQIGWWIPAVVITIWFTTMVRCPTPARTNTPQMGPDPMTRAERAAYNAKHPQPAPKPADKSVREQIRDLLVSLTGADKMVDCVREPNAGDCLLGFGPFVAGPLAKGALGLAGRTAARGAEESVAAGSVARQAAQKPPPTVPLFRNVDAGEFGSIADTGQWGTGPGQMEGKWFATEGAHADQWGRVLNRGDGLTMTTRIPRSLADQLHYHPDKLDGIGPGYYAQGDQLMLINQQMSGIELWP
ncbi:RHS repeat-associated core domain-containing protein [Amycolatopsis sp. DG1A-15b]|uniref:RHS repeat-associated core domain-containing protein n=1 Tax=Amycolatopsis sp. DG1A-15b TaxID=3052846 RepID=UPI00255BF214|nr:RHS repeat-associated core domain-containing protein [Amycolatopsis sp. DG1A-15b]WIX84937.1 RHS repeat-associated core domain-containing protein [Amycolatopsis sp. DG1A-15b]